MLVSSEWKVRRKKHSSIIYLTLCQITVNLNLCTESRYEQIDPWGVASGSSNVVFVGRVRTLVWRLLSFNVCKWIKSRLLHTIPARSRHRQPLKKNRSLGIFARVKCCCDCGESAYLNVEVQIIQRMSREEKFLANGTVEVLSNGWIRSSMISGSLYFDGKSCRVMGDENGAFNHHTSAQSWIELD